MLNQNGNEKTIKPPGITEEEEEEEEEIGEARKGMSLRTIYG